MGYANIECRKEEDEANITEEKKAYKMNCYITKKKENEVYCLKSTSAGPLYSCENDCSSINSATTSCYTIASRTGYYLPYQKNNLIKCSDSSCNLKSPVVTEGYYKSEDNGHSLIRCNPSVDGIRCEYETKINSGYYIGNDKNLIYCNGSKCVEVKPGNSALLTGWFKSAETGKVLVKCENGICKADSKPSVGWYLNGGNADGIKDYTQTNYQLIQCTRDASMNVSCEEKNPENEGYFICADNNKKLISCTSGECSSTLVDGDDNYYVNGVNKKLIYCKTLSCEGYEKNGWFGKSNSNAIYCNGSCTEKAKSEMKKGYYLNAGHNSSSKPLLKYDTNILEESQIFNGWYINAGSSTLSDKIIECDGTTKICNVKAATITKTNGKFYEEGGEIKLYLNSSQQYLTTDEDETNEIHRYIYAKVSKNLFTWIANESSGSILFEIHNNRVIQKKIDGYSFDENNNILYKCNGDGSGICTEINNSEIDAGYYINYTDKKLIRCNYDTNENKMICLNISSADCDKYNIKIDGDNGFKLCKKSTPGINISTLPVETIYVLAQPTGEGFVLFPKPKNTNNYRYFLANVNKYYVNTM